MTNEEVETKPAIERRFLTRSSDWKKMRNEQAKLFIAQAYPENLQDSGKVVRVRHTDGMGNTIYEQCEKGTTVGICTPEKEWLISKANAEVLFSKCLIQCVRKWRWLIPLGSNLIAFVDEFTHIRNERSTMIISEVEFASEKQGLAFIPPEWLGEEITGNNLYSNFGLAKNGEPLR